MTELDQRIRTGSGSDRVPMDVINLQRNVKIDQSRLRAFASEIPKYVTEAAGSTFTVALIDDARMRELNETFRGKDSATDVLSFPHEPGEFDPRDDFLGDIVISAETARRQASENGLTLENEIKQLILHGLLHLCGYDHETDGGEMEARELELRIRLDI